MPVNKHALIRYHALDKCFRNFARRFYIKDLITACNEALYRFTGNNKYADEMNPGISRRQILADIEFMEERWNATIEHIKDGRQVYFRYEDPHFTIDKLNSLSGNGYSGKDRCFTASGGAGCPYKEGQRVIICLIHSAFLHTKLIISCHAHMQQKIENQRNIAVRGIIGRRDQIAHFPKIRAHTGKSGACLWGRKWGREFV